MLPPGIYYRSLVNTTCGNNNKCTMVYLIRAPFLSFFLLLYLWAGTMWVLFFLVVLVIVFLIFYIHNLMEQSRRLSMIAGTSYNIDVDTGLDDHEIATLPMFMYERENNNSSSDSGDSDSNRWAQCAICLGILRIGETVKRKPACKHFFHVECINKWLRLHSTCPMCRSVVVPTPLRPPV